MSKSTDQSTTDLNTGVIRLNSVDEFVTQSTELIPTGIRCINIISHDLALPWLGQESVVDALKHFILSNRRARLRLLVGETRNALSVNHPLIPLIKKLSRIEARVIEEEILEKEPLKYEYLLVDRSGLVVKQKPDQYIGFAHHDDKTTVKNLKSSFDQYWRYSQPSPELRYFSI